MNDERPAGSARSRIAVVGATTDDGIRLREVLVQHRVSGDRVDLYGKTAGDVGIGEYDGEARLVQDPVAAEIARHDVIFLCEGGRLAFELAGLAEHRRGLIVDVVACLPAAFGSEVRSVVSVAHPIALILAELLTPLDRRPGLAEVAVVGIRPASDFGEPGVEELRDQTVHLLRFATPPTEVFGRQLAFNLIPQAALARREGGLEDRIRSEVQALLEWPHSRIAVRLVAAPMFHGHAFQLRLRPLGAPTLSEIREVLLEAGLLGPEGSSPATPFEITDQLRTSVGDLAEDGLGAFWLWAVAGETATRVARRALELAVRSGRLEPRV